MTHNISVAEIRLILTAHLQFYLRHPLLIGLFIIGLSAGTALITAIQGLNSEAGNRYQFSTALIETRISHLIKPNIGEERLDGGLWLALRQAGIDTAQPVLEGRIRLYPSQKPLANQGLLGNEKSVANKNLQTQTLLIRGVNSLQWLNTRNDSGLSLTAETTQVVTSQSLALTTLLLDRKVAQRLNLEAEGEKEQPLISRLIPNEPVNKTALQSNIKSSDLKLPDIKLQTLQDLGPWAIMDIALADQLLGAGGQLSYIELSLTFPSTTGAASNHYQPSVEQIKQIIGDQARLIAVEAQEFDTLASAFFFNLSALAMLGYVVGAFLSYNAIRLALNARKTLLSQMLQLGCRQSHALIALIIELSLLSLLTALIGSVLGYLIANVLVFDVNTTLIGLYDLDRALVVHWQWRNLLIGFGLNISALILLLLTQFSQQKRLNQLARLQLPTIGLVLLLIALLFFQAQTPFQAIALCASILMLFILLTPLVLKTLVNASPSLKHPLWQWLRADTQQHINEVSVAIIAILTAIGAAIGMQVMVGSFSTALSMHLEQRLSADFYIQPDKPTEQLRLQLQQMDTVARVGVYRKSIATLTKITEKNRNAIEEKTSSLRSKRTVNPTTAELVSYGPNAKHFQHLRLTDSLERDKRQVREDQITQGHCLANEPTKLKYGFALGETIQLQQHNTHFSCRVSGFYYDYGSQQITIVVAEPVHKTTGMNAKTRGFSVTKQTGINSNQLFHQLKSQLNLPTEQIVENARFKQLANKLFEKTFAVTHVLNGFIIFIALVGIWVSFLSLSEQQLSQLALLQTLGITRASLLGAKLVQSGLLITATLLIAIPLGLMLGYILLKFIMPIAFGWSMPMVVNTSSLITLLFWVFLAAISVAFIPLLKLVRQSPADHLAKQ